MISGKTQLNQVVHNVPTQVNNQNIMNGIYSNTPTYPTIFANPITSYEYVVNITDDFDAPQGFLNFLQDMGKKPKGKSLDRVDVNSGYSPENCAWTDYSTQVFNQRRRNRNTSGKTGVCWQKDLNKWQVSIRRNNVSYYLGVYSDFQEAVKVREDAELKYFGFIKE